MHKNIIVEIFKNIDFDRKGLFIIYNRRVVKCWFCVAYDSELEISYFITAKFARFTKVRLYVP